jgi:hypothetical protein
MKAVAESSEIELVYLSPTRTEFRPHNLNQN